MGKKLYWGLCMVPKTNDEIYVPISIGKYDYFSSVFCIVPKKVLLLK